MGGESASLLLRGWIVPVGGSTPDRRCCRPALPNSHSPTGIPQAAFDISGFGIADRHSAGVERSGLVPVGGCTPDRNDPPPLNICRAFKFGKALPQSIFQTAFCHLLLCFRVGGAFRSGVQPPTGSRLGVQSPTGAGLGTTGGQDRGGAWEGGVSFLRTLAFGFPPGFFGWREFLACFRGGIL